MDRPLPPPPSTPQPCTNFRIFKEQNVHEVSWKHKLFQFPQPTQGCRRENIKRYTFLLTRSKLANRHKISIQYHRIKAKKKKYQSCLATTKLKDEEHMIYLFILTTEQTRSIIQFPSEAKVISSQHLIFGKKPEMEMYPRWYFNSSLKQDCKLP